MEATLSDAAAKYDFKTGGATQQNHLECNRIHENHQFHQGSSSQGQYGFVDGGPVHSIPFLEQEYRW